MIVLLGASSGLGESVIEDLLEKDDVIATYNKTEINIESPKLIKKQLNLLDESAVDEFSKWVSKEYSQITFINFASLSVNKLFLYMSVEDWDQMHRINVLSSVIALKNILKTMISDRWGRVIFISSYVAEHGCVGASGYSTSKSSLRGLCKTLTQEYGRYGINCNVLQLGYMSAGLIESVPENKRKELLSRIPKRSFGDASDVGAAIGYLMDAEYVNGSILEIDGGL